MRPRNVLLYSDYSLTQLLSNFAAIGQKDENNLLDHKNPSYELSPKISINSLNANKL